MVYPPYKKEYTSNKKRLRKIFNKNYLPKINKGKLEEEIRQEIHLNNPPAGEPYCTKSQFVNYKNKNGKVIAGAHRYLNPDGKIGASGKPDPKIVVVNDKILFYKP